MKVSRAWLQKYFDTELPSVEALADALTFHSCEIEEIEGEMLDLKVLPDRAAYALSHRGIAGEISAILGIPMKTDPLRAPLPQLALNDAVSVSVDPAFCLRHTAAIVTGVKVGPSPAWLADALAAVGQRSINNIVDATNYVMLDIGQPMHAFDAGKLGRDGQSVRIDIREAKEGEKVAVLTGEEYTLAPGMYVIADATTGTALDIAGIKGGMGSGVDASTTDLFISVGNYDGTFVRRAATALKLYTDASQRYQNRPSPELTAYGMREILALIQEVAGGTVTGQHDVYPAPATITPVTATIAKLNGVLGSDFSTADISGVFDRLGFTFTEDAGTYTVTPSFERRDIQIPEDLAEEVGRIIGYDKVASTELPEVSIPHDPTYAGLERIRDTLRERGYTEISTQSFARAGDITLANPLDKSRPALRIRLADNMEDALTRAALAAPRVLGPAPAVHLFEIGSVFPREGEHLSLALGYRAVSGKTRAAAIDEIIGALKDELGIAASVDRVTDGIAEISLQDIDLHKLGSGYTPVRIALGPYRSFSVYPFALRDIAVWTPLGTEESEVAQLILKEAGDELARIDQFDRFEKDGQVSYAFRLVFESSERTLSDADLDPAMERITLALNAREGWTVR